MKTSLITTVYNESTAIEAFLRSIIKQTILPSEVIIVDAGSNDSTVEKIKDFFRRHKNIHGKLIVKRGNRSIGRNTAVRNAKNEIILCTDAGCTLDKKWVEEISKPFLKKGIDVVSGFYKPVTKNIFQKSLATYTSTMSDKLNPKTFLPSSRSIAFRKAAWKKAKGYPKELDTCEDLVFDKRLQKSGANFFFQKSALVFWPQRKNLLAATKQFFWYAKGDGKAHFFRKSTPFLFARYLVGFFATFAAISYRITKLEMALAAVFLLYLTWAVSKNYKYIHNTNAIIWLPILQLFSDIAVLLGTSIGFLQSLQIKTFIKHNIWLLVILAVYSVVVLSGIDWGIPNNNHPFNYHMDEWAQAQSIRDIFRHGTPNINGASHGAIFFYFLGGVYLIPFILLHIVNPFVIKNSLQHIAEQHVLFEVLRINTLLWGLASIALTMYIAKKYLQSGPFIAGLLFVLSPVWLVLSNYYKYDIGLTFWIVLTILFTFRYAHRPTLRNFLFLGFVSALTMAVKISAIPLIGTYVIAFFLFTPQWKKKLTYVPLGLLLFGVTFVIFGIPDLLLGIGDYGEWFHANLVSGPNETPNYNIHEHYLIFLFREVYPLDFGKILFPVFSFSVFYWIFSFIRQKLARQALNKYVLYLFISLFFFLASLFSLKLSGNRNRLLVLLPFFVLLTTSFLNYLLTSGGKIKKLAVAGLVLLCVLQGAESFAWTSTKFPAPQELSSKWILNNIPAGTTIGLTNVPIFENIPDILLKEYYMQIYQLPNKIRYSYIMINSRTEHLPKTIVLTNTVAALKVWKQSDKKDLLERLNREHYSLVSQFTPNMSFLRYFSSLEEFYFGNIASPTDVSVYVKK